MDLNGEGNKTGGDWYMVNEQWDKMSAPEYMQFTRKWIAVCHKILKDNGSIYISGTYHNLAEIMIVLKQLDFKINIDAGKAKQEAQEAEKTKYEAR